jgi:dipeptidyl aminopeptidase/acylaminoacyl peptidase
MGAASRYPGTMKFLAALALAACAYAAQPPFTLDQVLGAAFPTELTAAPAGGKFAWVSDAKGVRNIMVAGPPGYQARKITPYTADDGQDLTDIRWTPDAAAIVFVRGQDPNRAGEVPNPTHDAGGATQDVWIVSLDGGAPRKIAQGNSPSVAPVGGRVAFLRGNRLWWAPLDGHSVPEQIFAARGSFGAAVWSPDGSRFAFTTDRGDHGFVGVYEVATHKLSYLDPSTDVDLFPAWSPDGRKIAFARIPSSGLRVPRQPHRAGEPWSIRVADAGTGKGSEIWRAETGPGSVFHAVTAEHQLMWTAGGRIVFPWEAGGWTHLYSISASGGKPELLTPGRFEVEDVALTPSGDALVYSSNQDDIDRRHLWKVSTAGGTQRAVTSGEGIECHPAVASNGEIAFLRSDARRPLRVAIGEKDLDTSAIPADFPLQQMVAPRQVVFSSADGLTLHGQLFLPPNHPAGRSPAIVFFHGGSRRQMLLGWHPMYYYSNAYALNQYLANSGYIVLSVNYRSGTGYGLNFREALHYGANGGSEYSDVQGAGTYLRSRPDVDPARIGVWGGSYGGYLVAMALARASDMFAAGVDFHGVHDWATELEIPSGAPDYQLAFDSSPMAYIKDWRSPVLLIQGDDDRDVHFNQTVVLNDALRRQGVDVEEMVIPDEIHDFLLWRTWRDTYQATVDYFKRKL